MSRPTKLGQPIAEWPEAHRLTWQTNIKRQPWSRNHAAAIRRGVERWFAYAGAGALPTPGLVAGYEDALRATVSDRTALTYLQHLAYGIQLVAPDAQCEWLVRSVLDRLPRPAPKPRTPIKAPASRLALPVAEWPAMWRASWEAITKEASRSQFRRRREGPTSGWSTSYRRRVERGVSLLAGFIAAHNRSPSLTEDLIHDFLDDCADRGAAGKSMGMYVAEIRSAFMLLEPERDLSWLYVLARELKAAPPVRDKAHRLMRSGQIQEGGRSLMRRARQRPLCTETALKFRDGLILAVWALRPYRLSDFAALTLGESLMVNSGWATIVVHETKNGDGHVTPWPRKLLSDLQEYLQVYRPYLVNGGPDDGRVWIGRDGWPLTTGGLSRQVGDVTERLFGQRINPHLLRDCCVTSIVEADPREAPRASALAGHRDPRTTERHYQHASSFTAADIIHKMLNGFRKPSAARTKSKR